MTCKSTNIYLVSSSAGWIMVDAGWPETFPMFMNLLKQNNLTIGDIKYLFITHFHPDHAGIAQDLKDLGIKLVIYQKQVQFIDELNSFFRKNRNYRFKEITLQGNNIVTTEENRVLLQNIGISGELIPTPGHSNDSISLAINDCCAFIGDLPVYSLIDAYDEPQINRSWDLLKKFNIKKIYPAHGPACDME